ncbi:uncharacterized protein LOC143346608 isoform X2 [Colletes latitarsis]|uniref:uncharacterized protein LOC143346608 isoform X2 n=1 Tax=Colletes latitarsis TaxID=2605962 RepID=UPI00403739A8
MALQMQDTGEFKLVTRRKKRVFSVQNSCDPNVILFDGNDDSDADTNYEALFGKLLQAETELRNSLFGDDVFHYLQDSLRALDVDGISEILCYGLGHFSRRKCSKYQLALLLSLKNYYGSRVERMMKPNVQLVRSLIKEIRRSSSERNAKDNIMVRYILEQTRAHRETSEVLCKAREELNNLAETYLCYLSSRRICKEIQVRYTGKGERSIKETADLVGFKLPHDPK